MGNPFDPPSPTRQSNILMNHSFPLTTTITSQNTSLNITSPQNILTLLQSKHMEQETPSHPTPKPPRTTPMTL